MTCHICNCFKPPPNCPLCSDYSYTKEMLPDYEILSVYWMDTKCNGEDLLQIEMRAPGTIHMVRIEGVLAND